MPRTDSLCSSQVLEISPSAASRADDVISCGGPETPLGACPQTPEIYRFGPVTWYKQSLALQAQARKSRELPHARASRRTPGSGLAFCGMLLAQSAKSRGFRGRAPEMDLPAIPAAPCGYVDLNNAGQTRLHWACHPAIARPISQLLTHPLRLKTPPPTAAPPHSIPRR